VWSGHGKEQIGGYFHLLEALADPRHPEHDDLTEWLGGGFAPAAFDPDAINQCLSEMVAAAASPD
jgi:hypothetical protein